MALLGPDWRSIGGGVAGWFDAPTLATGAELGGRVVDVAPGAAVDVRSDGVRVRLDDHEHAASVSAIAHDLGLRASPTPLREVSVVIESARPGRVRDFWARVVGYLPHRHGGLVDPLRRDPALRIRPSDEARPLRDRIHLDVVRPASIVEQVSPGEAGGPYGVRHADPDGNEVDLVPGDPLGETRATEDWQVVFAAIACYRIESTRQQGQLAVTAAELCDEVGFPLLIDLRPGFVILDSGKDRWDAETHGLDLDVVELAERIQAAAREVGATSDPGAARFVQLFLDVTDIAAARSFWAASLGYVHDPRTGVTDIVDPRRLNPALVFQPIDLEETERCRQRNRIRIELAVPHDAAPARVDAALAAGGRLLDETANSWRVADPDGNELEIVISR